MLILYIPLTYPLLACTLGWSPTGFDVTRTTLFKSNRSQAVRLPKDVAFPDSVTEISILRDGARRVLLPANAVWDDFFDSAAVDLGNRDQPQVQVRAAF